MLKVQRPAVEALKCGEVFLLKTADYVISCLRCKQKIQFNKFQSHFFNSHLTQAQRRLLYNLVEQSESEDPIGIDVKSENEDEVNLKLLDEQPIVIEQIIRDDVVKDSVAGKNPSATTTAAATEDINDVWSDDDLEPLKPKEYDSVEGISAITATGTETQHGSDDEFDLSEPSEFGSSNDLTSSSSSEPIKETLFPCSICDRSYRSRRKLNVHLRRVHKKCKDSSKKVRKKSGADPPYKCETCGDGFWKEIQLKNHDMTKHSGIKCDICDKSFKSMGNLYGHKRRHTGTKDIKCDHCDKAFFTKRERNAHSLTHTRNYRIICEICGKPCTDGGALTAHMRRHTEERPFKCKVCGKGFFSGYYRNIHESGHSDERPFKCEICGRAFRYKRAVRVHKKIHVKERNFPCHLCDKRFINEEGVKEHMRSHTKTLVQKEEENSLMDETLQIIAEQVIPT